MIRYFKGEAYGVNLSLLCGEVVPGNGAKPHTHAYDELFVIHSGRGRYTIRQDTLEAGPGDIVVIPAGVPHEFVSVGTEPLRQTSVHSSPVFEGTQFASNPESSPP